MPLRLVATDLDGTIVRRDGTVSARTVAALDACHEAGVHVVFVTGRPPRWMAPVAEATGHTGIALCGNGALVYDLAAEQVLHARTLDAPTAGEVVRRLRDTVEGVTIGLETLLGFRREASYETRERTGLETFVADVEELLADDPGVVKVLARVPGRLADDLLAAVRPVLHGLAWPTHSNPRDGLLEVSALGVSKAVALAELAVELDVRQSDVVAFGDMPNDVEMLTWAGAGYVVADGHPEAIAAADHVAPPCIDDGVAQVIERLLAAR